LDLAPGLFNYYVQTDPGYNVGPWNFHERLLSVDDNGQYLVNEKPLRLFHFSGAYSNYFNSKMKGMDYSQKSLINTLKKQYLQEVSEAAKGLSAKSWSYGCFTNCRSINKESRLIFRNKFKLFKNLDNPFSKDNHFFKLILKRRNQKKRKTTKSDISSK